MTKTSEFKRIMAIDFGLKRIGIALTDPLKIFAYSFKTIYNDSKTFDEIGKIINDQDVEKIILGLPLKESGADSSITKDVIKFKDTIEKKFLLEVLLRDERYSSSIAMEQILQSVSKKSKRKEKSLVDKGAAAVILQGYLDEIK